ncbi:MAG TPA: nitrile hydratase subunit beta [Steroidobacteraceae bacterium]|nr:nitrile hydratase subunit beta [Steroidobacteraceae bacterium]
MTYHSYADLGGEDVRGAIVPEAEGELFHAPWEPRVMALVVAMGPTGMSNIDMNRSVRETLPNYRDLSYYEIWLAALEKLALQKGLLGRSPPPPKQVLRAETVLGVIKKGFSVSRPASAPARFSLGERVRTAAAAPPHHTRLPKYARGKVGVIERVHGVHVFPDTNAQGLGESPQWLYTVAFDAQELWGENARLQGGMISVDAFEPYLERA